MIMSMINRHVCALVEAGDGSGDTGRFPRSVQLSELAANLTQVVHKTLIVYFLLRVIDLAQDRGWMDGHEGCGRPWRFRKAASDVLNANHLTEHRLRGGRAKADEDARADRVQLRLEPRAAGGDLAGRRAFVFAALALRLPFKVLDRVGHIDLMASDAGFYQGFVQYSPRRSHKGMALEIFLIAGLFPDEEYLCVSDAFPKYGLRRLPIQIAPRAVFGRLAQLAKGGSLGNKLRSGTRERSCRHGSRYHALLLPCAHWIA